MVGAEIIYNMQKAVRSYEKSGKVVIKVDTRVTKLVTENDRVVGVFSESTVDGVVEEILGDYVILATGGFASDRSKGSYLDQTRPELMAFPATAGSFSTGDGITLATALEAGTRDMDKIQVHPTGWVDPVDPSNPTKTLAAELMRGVGGILLKDGRRFCNELGTRAYVTDKMLQSDPQYSATGKWEIASEVPTFHLVLSSSAAADGKRHVDLYSHKGLLNRVEGLDALAEHMGVKNSTLKSTIRNYQKAALKGEDEFGKTSFRGVPMDDLSQEVFYVGVITPVLHYCMGGIKIDKEGTVLKEDGTAIPGLLAAGEVTGGVHGINRLAGNSLLECTVFGTIVGQKVPIKEGPSRLSTAAPKEQKKVLSKLPVITMEELAEHNTEDDLWVALHGIVYDFTEFAHEHPSGFQSIFELVGTDGTDAFSVVHNIGMLDDFEEDKKGILKSD
jgi:flavocytochrome c